MRGITTEPSQLPILISIYEAIYEKGCSLLPASTRLIYSSAVRRCLLSRVVGPFRSFPIHLQIPNFLSLAPHLSVLAPLGPHNSAFHLQISFTPVFPSHLRSGPKTESPTLPAASTNYFKPFQIQHAQPLLRLMLCRYIHYPINSTPLPLTHNILYSSTVISM